MDMMRGRETRFNCLLSLLENDPVERVSCLAFLEYVSNLSGKLTDRLCLLIEMDKCDAQTIQRTIVEFDQYCKWSQCRNATIYKIRQPTGDLGVCVEMRKERLVDWRWSYAYLNEGYFQHETSDHLMLNGVEWRRFILIRLLWPGCWPLFCPLTRC